jgi:rhodanese-related sulfurtransferase
MVSRQEIEVRTADSLAHRLTQAFDRFCGPEIDSSVVIADPFAEMEISPIEVKALRDSGVHFEFLDVRTDPERAIASIDGSRLVTQELVQEISEAWPRDTKMVLFCHTGQRSLEATKFLRLRQGFTDVRSMSGGITAWSAVVDRAVPTY